MNDILKEIKRLLENNQIEDAIKFIDKNLKKKQKAGDYQSLTRLMNNETSSIKFETLEKMCDIFNCEISDIVVRKKGRKRK